MPSLDHTSSDFVTIIVADSTRIHTQLLADALRNDSGLQVSAASSSQELLDAVTRVPIDVVVVSHNLDNEPGRGAQVLREMRAIRPQIKGVILLDTSTPETVLECFRAGARGIFSKEERLESLCKCIRSVHEGQVWARSADLDHVLAAVASAPVVRATNHKGIELLSAREREVIQHMAGGMTNREIAHALKLSPHTVKNYLFRIFDKLGVSSRTELLYLTMNSSGIPPQRLGRRQSGAFAAVIEAAEAGDPSAQLQLAEHFCQIEATPTGGSIQAGAQSVSAYAWYLIAEKASAPMLEQIKAGKEQIRRTMTPEQIAEAESRAAEWSRHAKKQSGFAAETESSSQNKMRAGAR